MHKNSETSSSISSYCSDHINNLNDVLKVWNTFCLSFRFGFLLFPLCQLNSAREINAFFTFLFFPSCFLELYSLGNIALEKYQLHRRLFCTETLLLLNKLMFTLKWFPVNYEYIWPPNDDLALIYEKKTQKTYGLKNKPGICFAYKIWGHGFWKLLEPIYLPRIIWKQSCECFQLAVIR